jgi:hypothetical protein
MKLGSLDAGDQTFHSLPDEVVHGEDVDFVVYLERCGQGSWQAVSTWMIPSAEHR